jgi:hypothetical protein
MASTAVSLVGQLRRNNISCLRVPKKLSTTELSQQSPFPLMLQRMPLASRAARWTRLAYWVNSSGRRNTQPLDEGLRWQKKGSADVLTVHCDRRCARPEDHLDGAVTIDSGSGRQSHAE